MKDLFYIDTKKNISVSYEYLYNELKNPVEFNTVIRSGNDAVFWTNLIRGLLSNADVTLIDSDIKEEEVSFLDLAHSLNILQKYYVPHDINILEGINKSSSTVTLFTSGTTGQPKKISHSIRSLTRNVKVGEKYRSNIWGFCYNPSHMAGLQVFFQALLNQNTIVNLFGYSRDYINNEIENNSITNLSATPTFYRMLMPVEKSYPSVQKLTFGGEKSDEKLYEKISRVFVNAKIYNIYASTEAGTLFTAEGEFFTCPEHLKRFVKVENNELFLHTTLIGRSEKIEIFNNWYQTGDLVEIINQKPLKFKFIGRKTEMINTGGYKVNPEEVKECILKIHGILDAYVFAKPSSVLGNIVCCEVKLVDGYSLKESDIRTLLKEKLQDYKIPRLMKFVEKIELTRTGKQKHIHG